MNEGHYVVGTTMRRQNQLTDPFPELPNFFYRDYPFHYFEKVNGVWSPTAKTRTDYLRDTSTRFVKIGMTETLPHDACGIELEVPMDTRAIHLDRMEKFYRGGITSEGAARMFLHSRTFAGWQPLVEPPHTDAGSEFVFTPMTLEVIQSLESFWEQMFFWLREHGYHEVQQGSGIHMNIDFGAFGANDEEICRNFERYLWFFFGNRTWYTAFSGRWGFSTVSSDSHLLYQIPLSARLGDIREQQRLFRDHKIATMDDLRQALAREVRSGSLQGEIGRIGNISLGRDGRRCFEFRHFSSTVFASTFLEMVEGMYCLISFCKTDAPTTLEALCVHALENVDKFPRFYNYLQEGGTTNGILARILAGESEATVTRQNGVPVLA